MQEGIRSLALKKPTIHFACCSCLFMMSKEGLFMGRIEGAGGIVGIEILETGSRDGPHWERQRRGRIQQHIGGASSGRWVEPHCPKRSGMLLAG